MADVIVFGGANIDIKARTSAAHISATSNPGQVTFSHGGVGRNIAINLAKLGNTVKFVTAIGDDVQGAGLIANVQKAGVETSLCIRVAAPTGSYCAVTDQNGELVTAVSSMAIMDHLNASVIETCRAAISGSRVVVADCNLPVAALQALSAQCREKLVIEPVSVVKCMKLREMLTAGPLFAATPNRAQAETLTGAWHHEKQVAALHAMGLCNVVLHAGSEGAFASTGSEIQHVPSRPAGEIVDVTGAGDAATAGLVHGLMQGLCLKESVELGQKLAGRLVASRLSAME